MLFNNSFFALNSEDETNTSPKITYLSSPLPKRALHFSPSFLDSAAEVATENLTIEQNSNDNEERHNALETAHVDSAHERAPDTLNYHAIRKLLHEIEERIEQIHHLLAKDNQYEIDSPPQAFKEQVAPPEAISYNNSTSDSNPETIYGVFIGDNSMKCYSNKIYSIPPNYASKSKLVEGDRLKLTIKENGRFLYKQIGPVERKSVRGILNYDELQGQWYVLGDGKQYKVLAASITFYKGSAGDEVVIFVPAGQSATWAAVDNIITS